MPDPVKNDPSTEQAQIQELQQLLYQLGITPEEFEQACNAQSGSFGLLTPPVATRDVLPPPPAAASPPTPPPAPPPALPLAPPPRRRTILRGLLG